MAVAEIKVEGLRELRQALITTIPREMQGKVLQRALAAGTKLIVEDAQTRAPVKTGRLSRAIYATRDSRNSSGIYEARVVTVRRGKKFQKTNRDAYYWKFIEFGHRTGARKGQYLQKLDGRRSHGRAVKATGFVAARPFMRPAFEAKKYQALEAIQKRLRIEIDRAAKKASWFTAYRDGRKAA